MNGDDVYSFNDGFYVYENPSGYSILSKYKKLPDGREKYTSVVGNLNESGGKIISLFGKGNTISNVLKEIKGRYGKDAEKDAAEFIEWLIKRNYLQNKRRSDRAVIGSRDFYLPAAITFEVTERCVQSCIHCYIKDIKTPERLTPTGMKYILDLLEPYGLPISVNITGGEPFLVDGIWDFFDILSKRDYLHWALFTTGIPVDEKISKRLSQYPNLAGIHVSLDGNEELHDFIRGKGSYKKTIRGIKNILKYNKNILIATITIKGRAKETIEAIVSEMKNLNIPLDRLQLEPYFIPVGRGEKIKDLVPTLDEIELTNKLMHEYGILEQARDTEAMIQKSHDLGIGEGNCGAGYITLDIAPNGDVYPCIIMTSYPQFRMGNIFDDSMEKIFKEEARKWVYRKTPSEATCGNCPFLPFCRKCFGFEIAYCKHPGWLIPQGLPDDAENK